MSGNGNENRNNSPSNQTETVTISSDDPQKVKDLQKMVDQKQAELNELKKTSGIEISNLKKENQKKENQKKGDDAKPQEEKPQKVKKENIGTRNNVVYGPGYRNGYADGTFKKEFEKLRKQEKIDRRGSIANKN